jgi:predicted AlkP superfamily pyrophosphatase or phosphodiesterase
MRYDYAKYDDEYADFLSKKPKTKNIKNYLNQFKAFKNIMLKEPNNTVFLRAISDPPTVTNLRIKSFVHGNLPSFIDFINNFSPEEVSLNFTH